MSSERPTLRQLLECGSRCAAELVPTLRQCRASLNQPSSDGVHLQPGVPHMFAAWLDTMAESGNPMHRLCAVLGHTAYHNALHAALFAGETPENKDSILLFLDQQINTALLGRNSDGSKMTAEQIAMHSFRKFARVVLRVQEFVIAL